MRNPIGFMRRGTCGSISRGGRILYEGLGITEIKALQDCVEFREERLPVVMTQLDLK